MTSETPWISERLWANATAPDISLLKVYTRFKQSIARSIRAIQNRLAKEKWKDGVSQYQELIVNGGAKPWRWAGGPIP